MRPILDLKIRLMLQLMVRQTKSSWHLQLLSTVWDFQTIVKTSTSFIPFQLVYGLEVTLPIECEIPSLKLVIELLRNTTTKEECFLYFIKLNETCRDVTLANEVHKIRIKAQYYRYVQPCVLNEGDLVLTYYQKHDKLGGGKLESLHC